MFLSYRISHPRHITSELFSVAQQGLIGWVKKNLDILMEVMNSVWLIVQANLNILTSILGTFLSLFLGGGQAVITFIINSVRTSAIGE